MASPQEAKMHFIDEDLSTGEAGYAEQGLLELEEYLKKHLDFLEFLVANGSGETEEEIQ
ncbi:MAG TPA: hypothetical protein VHD84_03555 [Candidatus Saccharimonadales bacterium]|nr:hypothetical protein [Candidatus Saccharimonadales bacterium]